MKIPRKFSADNFSNYLFTVCDLQKITQVTSNCVHDQGYQPQTIFFFRVTKTEIDYLIATLKNKNFVGSDDLRKPDFYLKMAFNRCIAEGVFPLVANCVIDRINVRVDDKRSAMKSINQTRCPARIRTRSLFIYLYW